MPAPVVTVIVPSYNYARYLPGALRGVLSQSMADFELLLVEDGSTDQSPAVARSFAARDSRVRMLTHADGRNHGLPAALALALAEARGRWTAFLEADDLWHPQCLERRLETAEKSGAGVVCNDIAPFAMSGADTAWFEGYVPRVMRWHAAQAALPEPGATLPPSSARLKKSPWAEAVCDVRPFLLENKIPTFSCAMARTGLLRRISLRTPVPRWLDWWIWAQLSALAPFAFVPEKLTRWRLHPKSWHHKVEIFSYLEEYRRMGRGFRRLFARELARRGQWGALAFLLLPATVRLAARLALTTREDGLVRALRRISGRLDVSRSIRKL